jgi:hypothetical protein
LAQVRRPSVFVWAYVDRRIGAFALWFPLVFIFVRDVLLKLFDRYPWLAMPFDGSMFPALSINFGRRSISFDHRDYQNAPGVPCSITALGRFDHTRGGHLVLFDYGLVSEFPSGSTAQILSGCARHGNTQVGADDTRYSIIQYMAAGLWRHVEYGYRVTDELSLEEQKEFERTAPARLQSVVDMFSTPSSVVNDRLRIATR